MSSKQKGDNRREAEKEGEIISDSDNTQVETKRTQNWGSRRQKSPFFEFTGVKLRVASLLLFVTLTFLFVS